jgi:hypothetical protein
MGSFWWRDFISLQGQPKEFFHCKPATGATLLFWLDKWNNGVPLKDTFPQLLSFAKLKRITM